MLLIFHVMALVVFLEVPQAHGEDQCHDPPHFNLTLLQDKPIPLKAISRSYVTPVVTPLEDSTCPESEEETILRNGYFTSCPTHDVQDHDPNRSPAIIVQKRCRCQGCVATSGSCIPIYAMQQVLRKVGCSKGVNQYRPALEPVVVGCQCMKLCGFHIPLENCPLFSGGRKMSP